MLQKSTLGIIALVLVAYFLGHANVGPNVRNSYGAGAVEVEQGGRYQLIEGAVVVVFDTQTGIRYAIMPRDKEENTGPYIMEHDPVNARGAQRNITWTAEKIR